MPSRPTSRLLLAALLATGVGIATEISPALAGTAANRATSAPAKKKKGEAEAEEPAPVAEEGEGGELAEWQRKLLKLKAEVGGEGEG